MTSIEHYKQKTAIQSKPTKQTRPTQLSVSYRPNGFGFEDAEILTDLGLTSRQARVYLALLKAGQAKAKAIADLSLVNRQEIYRIIEDLQQIGLVQKTISAPTTFMATPASDVIKMLLEKKINELKILRQKTRQLTKKLSHITIAPITQACLGVVFEADRAKKYRQTIQATRQKIDITTSWSRFKQLTTLLEVQLEEALQKGVVLRIATDRPHSQPLPSWITNLATNAQALSVKNCLNLTPKLKPNLNLTLKFLSSPPAAAVTIFDQTTAAIAFHPGNSLTRGPDLWTTNPTLVALSQAYFNETWTQTN